MDSIRSIVWIGDERLAVELAADCPTLERPSTPPFFSGGGMLH